MKRWNIYILAIAISFFCLFAINSFWLGAGKRVTVYQASTFNPYSYKWRCPSSKLVAGNLPYTSVLDIESVFWQKLNMAPSLSENGLQTLKVEVCENIGFCLPPGISKHFKPIFFMPREIDVFVSDARTNSLLLSIKYESGLFAVNAKYEDALNMLSLALINAFEKARLPHKDK